MAVVVITDPVIFTPSALICINPSPLVLPAPGGDKTTAGLDSVLAGVAAKVPNTSFANPEPLFNPYIVFGGAEEIDLPAICTLTAMCPGGTYNPTSPEADIHPTAIGYATMATVLGAEFFEH